MRNKTKKIFIAIVLGVYLLTNFFQSAFFASNTVYAAWNSEDQIDYTNIVAIIVNDKIYDNIKDDVQRYATKYIQWDGNNKYTAISNSKALVFPINVENFSAKNISQLLENIYFDWISWEPSRLIWVILIWDIPLPVVNQNWYIYPTIYPYVDFEEQKFIWDDETKYFVYNNNPNWQAEIWHWMINFGENMDDYGDYFNKLKQYWRNPSSYIWKAIWYDDFVWNKKYFNENWLNFYLNNFIFSEDLGYHRYNDLMIKVLQWQRNSEIEGIMNELNDIYADLWSTWFDLGNLSLITQETNTPTMQIKALLDNGYLSKYSSLFWQKFLKTIANNIETANRWTESRTWSDGNAIYTNALDTHYIKTEIADETVLRMNWWAEPFLIMINNALEEIVDNKVDDEKYWMNEVIPLTYLNYKWKSRWLWKCVWEVYDAYENYLFGENAQYLLSMEDASTYRWTFRNYIWIDWLTIQDIQNSQNPSTDVSGLDLNKKSIWWSYEIFATQVDANRWYNYNNSVEEFEIYSGNKTAKMENWDVTCVKKFLGICIKRRRAISNTNGRWCDLSDGWDQWWCETPQEYAIRIWWGASPLNLDINWTNFSWKSGYTYTGATSPIFDIAGSLALDVSTPEYESNSFESISKYSSLILRRFSPNTRWPKFYAWNPQKKAPATYWFGYDSSMDYEVKFTNKIPTFNGNSINWWINKNVIRASDINYFEKYNSSATREWDIIKISKTNAWGDASCRWAGEIYTYKTLDSRVKNDSVSETELNGISYKIFQDNHSHVKQFYDELSHFIDTISGSIDEIVWNNTWSLKNNLLYIKDKIDEINEWFETLIDFDENSLENYNTWQINALATTWQDVFDINDIENLSGKIGEVQDLVLELSWFVEMWWWLFYWIIDFVENEKTKFIVNWRDLIFLNRRKENLAWTITSMLNNYYLLKTIVAEAFVVYQTIGEIWSQFWIWGISFVSLDVVDKLAEKKENISNFLQWSWCETKYKDLCDTLDDLIYNYNTYTEYLNDEKNGINNLKVEEFNDEWEPSGGYSVINNIFRKLLISQIFTQIDDATIFREVYSNTIGTIPWTWNEDLMLNVAWMNMTTSDRPIDSPRYMTFKGIWWDKVTFIYPDIYKAEIFSGDSSEWVLTLKSTGEIAEAIRDYLKGVATQYNKYLREQVQKREAYYNANSSAYNTLARLDPLASPQAVNNWTRPYRLFDENYLVDQLEYRIRNSVYFSGEELAQADPIWFIADMLYYQNIARQNKTIWETIQQDFDNQRTDFDMNEKISYILKNYLTKDNNKWNFLTPDYRENGYEVAFINSDWNDYISYETTPPIVNTMLNLSQSYETPVWTDEENTLLGQQLILECNIPEQWWVLLFDFSDGSFSSPWWEAMKCRWEAIRQKPFEFKVTFPFALDNSTWFWQNLGNIFNVWDYEDIWLGYVQQMKLLDTSEINNEVIENMDLTNPWDAAKLQKILLYTTIKAKKTSISADNPTGEIEISSSTQLWNVEFHVVNVWESKIRLLDGDNIISNNISVWSGAYNTWKVIFDPYNQKDITIEIDNPIEWMNILIFYMCLPNTQNVQNCVRNSVRLNVVPGEVANISIQMEKNTVLEWASIPFKVVWTDKYGNNIWELISQRFETSSSSGKVVLNGVSSGSIKFSNFVKSNFELDATGGNLDGQTIMVQVSGEIAWVNGVKARAMVNVKKWRIDVYSGNNQISEWNDVNTQLDIKLPDENIYTIVDNYDLVQANTGTLPKLELRLVDRNGNTINMEWTVSVKTKNHRLTPWTISSRTVTKNLNWQILDVIQNRFSKTNYFELSGWRCTVYLLPNFVAGDDIIYISMPWTEDIQIPINISHATPKVVWLTAEHDTLNTNASMAGNLKIFDNWGNMVNSPVSVILRSANNKLSLSSAGNIQVDGGNLDFDIVANDKWWLWHIYAHINANQVSLDQQKPATLSITVQENMLPEKNLNVMYLNLFGNDRWNQWWYMSENDKYSENLIKNSDKLITVTTQLLNLENIKNFPIVVDNWLQIQNLANKDINLMLSGWFVFDINSVWNIVVSADSFRIEKVNVSENVLEQYISARMAGPNKNKNILFYVPEQIDSIIQENDVRNWAIYINNSKVFDTRDFTFDQNLTISLGEDNIARYQVWNMYFAGTFVWKVIIAADDRDWFTVDLNSFSDEYWISQIWINGSSNELWIGFYEIESQLPSNSFGYKSIQDSHNSTLWIWFTDKFKNITNFGWGMSVWEATLPFGSELLINIWDPLLKRINDNESARIYNIDGTLKKDTEFDLWLGEVIYAEPGKEILKVKNIDFNNDWLEDIIVVFKDWTIKILKNYGWTNPFQNLWALKILADRISDISVWDVDGNGYQDLIVWTEAGWLRVYKNNLWIFDVDGYPVCVNINVNKWEISSNPEKISGLHQIFLEDMDLDGAVDIVTNDSLWFIKIFYWWESDGNVNYLSTNKYMCDENWYERIEENSKTVHQFGIKVDSNSRILDQSLIRWRWLGQDEWDEITAQDVGMDPSNFENINLGNINQIFDWIWGFDISAATNLYKQDERLKKSWFGVIPAYETDIESANDVDYVEIGCLTGQDPVKVYKTYEDLNNNTIDSGIIDNTWSLVNGDLVRVTVYIQANESFRWTFIDNISGPWIIPLSEYDDKTFENFWFDSSYIQRGYITSWQIESMTENIYRDLDNARYMIDNINMRRWDRIKFSYWLIYNDSPVMDIEINKLTWSNFAWYIMSGDSLAGYLDYDEYPDITVQPQDGCNDSMFVFFNDWTSNSEPREYSQKYMDLAKIVNNYNLQSIENGANAEDEVFGSVWSSAASEDAQALWDQIWWFAGLVETMDRRGMLSAQWLNVSNTVNIWSEIINGLTSDAVQEIDKVIWWMCNWVDLSTLGLGWQGGCGLPVPFNQAFLWVWKYHLFGCYEIAPLSRTLGKWMPVLTIPGNWWPTIAWYIPAPWIFGYPFKWPSDGFFLGNYGWTWNSLFRLYLMPTLTLDLGIALCFGPYNVWANIPDPVGSIVWNCVVFAVHLPCGGEGSSNNLWFNATTEIPHEYTLLKWCSKQNIPCYVGNNESSSPFVLGASSNNSQNFYKAVPDGSFAWWFINIERKPETSSYYTEDNSFDIDAILLEGGANFQNKIEWSNAKWLIEKVVKSWLDKQIKYVMNNLTNFKISIIWPDFEWIIWKMPPVSKVNNIQSTTNWKKETCENNKWVWNASSWFCEDTPASLQLKCENRGLKRDSSTKTCKANDSALSQLDAWWQENLMSRDQVSSWSEYTNPFEQLEELFSETPLVNISTQDITIDVPMISSEDVTSYISMSQSWMNRQTEILADWQNFFTALVWFCGWSTNINWISDLQRAIESLKEQYRQADSQILSSIWDGPRLENLQWKIDSLQNLRQKYNLSDLWNYKVYEAQDWGFYVYTKYFDSVNNVIPIDVYLYFDPSTSDLTMFTSWFDLISNNINTWKTKISIKKNWQAISTKWLKIKEDSQVVWNACSEIFLDGTIDTMLNWFLNIQSSADSLMRSVKENIETLQMYKQFPVQLYEWIHVVDRYLGEISSLVNSVLWTLSMWMETNANRYSQYVDAIITLMTTLETYQLIIDLSADWTENCSTCTNDNYDQFTCKLGILCNGIDLPVIPIPPTKIPSIYLDFSEIHLETDIKLPNFVFNPIAVPLPQLPNIPSPPDIDLSLNLDETLAFGLDILAQLKLVDLNLNMWNLWGLPLIPSPPVLPDLPSFIPSVQMELPLLPPAPKIPRLPNEITTMIKAAEIIGKILCIVKWKFGLVAEASIKAKVEQMTQRDYEVAYWDQFDQTLSDWNSTISAGMPSILANMFTGFSALLQTNQFRDVKLKWFDLSLQTYVNLQYSFEDFYAFLQWVVNEINGVSYKLTDYASVGTNYVSNISKEYTDHLQACVNNIFSIECQWVWASEDINRLNGLQQRFDRYKKLLETWFEWLGTVLAELESKRDQIQNLQSENEKWNKDLQENTTLLNDYRAQLNTASTEIDRKLLTDKIEYTQKLIDRLNGKIVENNEKIRRLQTEIEELNRKYWWLIDSYNEMVRLYNSLSQELDGVKNLLLNKGKQVMDQINSDIEQAWQNVNFESLNILDVELKDGAQEIEDKKTLDKQRRFENLQNLYKEVEEPISYVDFDPDVNENNFRILHDTLAAINQRATNKDIKNRAQESMSLIAMDRHIGANIDAVKNVEKWYTTVLENYKNSNSEIADMIVNDYDKFLATVSDNEISLVNDNSWDITLSAKLFDMDSDSAKILLAQSAGWSAWWNSSTNMTNSNSNVKISNYIDGYTLNTKEGSFLLANNDYVNKFQSRFVLTDINGDGRSDLILWDENNIYVKYRWWNSNYENIEYENASNFYVYKINSYDDLVSDSENWFVKIRYWGVLFSKFIFVKVVDTNREVKNFKYAGQTFDTIKVSWLNSKILWDNVDGYLVKMIHRVDQFNDREILLSQGNNSSLFDKKYVLVLPKWSEVTWTKLELEEWTLNNTERWIWTWNRIFDLLYYNDSANTISLTVEELPRNWQYSEIYTLNFVDNTYKISSSSSNQIVAGPQIIADTQWPSPEIKLYRPATDKIVSEWSALEWYVWTNYILQVDWEDNVALNEIWIADEAGNTLARESGINSRTGYIELSGLYFTGEKNLTFYVWWVDIDGNQYVSDVRLIIKVPNIQITNILKWNQNLSYLNWNIINNPISTSAIPVWNSESFVTIVAQMDQDIDTGFVQFMRDRSNDEKWEILTGTVWWRYISSFWTTAEQINVYGGYFDLGDDIGLYSTSGDIVAKINPESGKITITPGFENNISIKLDYSPKIPVIKVMEWNKTLFWVIFSGKELVSLNVNWNNASVVPLENEWFGEFNGWKAVVRNGEVLLYVSPIWQIYTDTTLYGEYGFDNMTNSVIYTFRTNPNGANIWSVKIKIKNLLEY